MKLKFIYLTAAMPLIAAMTSCNNDEPKIDDETEKPVITTGAYIINTGNWGANDGSIQWYDINKGIVSSDIYAASNGKGIGDLQDLCVYGSKLYAVSSTSSKIEILDKEGKIIKSMPLTTSDNKPLQPRYATAGDGYVFFTAYDGTVSKLDTLSQEIVSSVNVGDHPEGLSYTKGKVFVNISGYGMGNTVAVVDANTMTKVKDITVLLNPYTQSIVGSDGFVYIVSNGNYASSDGLEEEDYIYGTLQRINPDTYQVEELCNASYIANKGDKMYILYSEYYLPDRAKCFVYDIKTGKETDFVKFSDIPNPGGIAVDPETEDVYIINQPYGALNDVYVYDKDGNKKSQFEAGQYTTGIRFVTE